MPARINPQSSGVGECHAIQSQCTDRSTPHRRQAGDDQTIFLPNEVIEPILCLWIEETYGDASLWIDRSDPIPLKEITSPAGQAQIIFIRRTSKRLGNDVIYGELGAHNGLRAQAIATPMLKMVGNRPTHCRRDGRLGHKDSSSVETS